MAERLEEIKGPEILIKNYIPISLEPKLSDGNKLQLIFDLTKFPRLWDTSKVEGLTCFFYKILSLYRGGGTPYIQMIGMVVVFHFRGCNRRFGIF